MIKILYHEVDEFVLEFVKGYNEKPKEVTYEGVVKVVFEQLREYLSECITFPYNETQDILFLSVAIKVAQDIWRSKNII